MSEPVTIREYQETDAHDLVAAVHESLGELLPWMPWASTAYSLVDATAWIRGAREQRAAGAVYDFAIVDAAGRLSGGCGLNQINHANGTANLGYWLRSSATRRGLATAAVRELAAWAMVNTLLNRLEIVAAVSNTRSLRVAERAGAHRDAVLEKRLIIDGEPCDAVLFSIVRPDS